MRKPRVKKKSVQHRKSRQTPLPPVKTKDRSKVKIMPGYRL